MKKFLLYFAFQNDYLKHWLRHILLHSSACINLRCFSIFYIKRQRKFIPINSNLPLVLNLLMPTNKYFNWDTFDGVISLHYVFPLN